MKKSRIVHTYAPKTMLHCAGMLVRKESNACPARLECLCGSTGLLVRLGKKADDGCEEGTG